MNQSKLLLFEIIVGSLIGLFVISIATKNKRDLENFALGGETKTLLAKDDGNPIHLINLDSEGISGMRKGWLDRGKKDVALILGNSQTHSINQLKEGDATYVQKLHNGLSDRLDILALTFPNANLQELYLGTDFLMSEYPIKFIVLPVFMDDLREDGIRESGFEYLIENFYQLSDTSSSILKRINANLSDFNKMKISDGDHDALFETVQAKSERFLDNRMSENFPLWADRPAMRGEMFLSLYKLRNTVFGINAQTKRKMIPSRYKDNFEAVNEILRSAKSKSIKVLLYIPPIRQDVEVPYNLSEYASFKKKLKENADRYSNVKFVNLENIVPAKYWGVKSSTNGSGKTELDFMHFQNEGHNLLYDSLKKEIQQLKNDI